MKRPNTTTVLLAVVAVLLGLNLVATSSPAAGNDANGTTNPYVTTIIQQGYNWFVRVWSDGRVDSLQRAFPLTQSCEFQLNLPGLPGSGPVQHPFPVVDAQISVFPGPVTAPNIMLTYEDGRVDLLGGNEPRCTVVGNGSPSFCIGDVDRDGTVGIEDFLTVLDQWGATCQ